MQTYMANPDKIERKWYVVDADGLPYISEKAHDKAPILPYIRQI